MTTSCGLHEWFVTPDGEFFRPSGPAGELADWGNATGAVLAGRRTVEQVDHWVGDHHDGVPIFVAGVPSTGTFWYAASACRVPERSS